MTPFVRISVIATLLAIAIAQVAIGIARAQPQTPLPHCHLVTSCTVIPAKVVTCPPPSAQTHPCNPQAIVIPAHKVCTQSKICGDQ